MGLFPVRLAGAVMLWIVAGAAPLPADWRQVGFFRSDGGNISVGSDSIRVVTVIDIDALFPDEKTPRDTLTLQRHYPGWDYRSNLEISYRFTPAGFLQSAYGYGIGSERKALPGDPIAPSLALFDHQGKMQAQIPGDIRRRLRKNARVVAAQSGNLDADGEHEWAIVVGGPWDDAVKGQLLNLSIIDRRDDGWAPVALFEIRELRRAGPLEIRDVTKDGKPDIIFRTFHTTPGHFWVEVRIFSEHPALRNVERPAAFRP